MKLAVDPNARALIFDLDGTLLDTMGIHFLAWREAMIEWDFDLTEEIFHEVGGNTTVAIVDDLNKRYGLSVDPAKFSIAKDQAYVRHVPRIKPFPVVLELLESARDRYPIAAATNESFGVANIVLRGTGLSASIPILVTVDDVERPKPAPDIYLETARRLGVEVEACQVFEDSAVGLKAADAAGAIVTDVRPFVR